MNQDIDIRTNKILQTGPMKKVAGEYTAVLLEPKDIPAMMGLQKEVFAALSADEQCFLHHKDEKFLSAHFARGNIAIGIVHKGRLVAQSVVVNPTCANPETGMTDPDLKIIPQKSTIIQGVIVHPDYRGNNLMTVMVDEWLAVAKAQGRKHAYSEVTVENFHSWSVFMKEGLHITGVAHDPADNSTIYDMHGLVGQLIFRRAKPDFNKAAPKKVKLAPAANIAMQKKLLADGYAGVRYDAANQNILFRAPWKKNPPKPAQGM